MRSILPNQLHLPKLGPLDGLPYPVALPLRPNLVIVSGGPPLGLSYPGPFALLVPLLGRHVGTPARRRYPLTLAVLPRLAHPVFAGGIGAAGFQQDVPVGVEGDGEEFQLDGFGDRLLFWRLRRREGFYEHLFRLATLLEEGERLV